MTRGECMAMLTVAGVVYGKNISESLVDAWIEFMRDVTPEEGVPAMRQHITESRFFPTVADIRQLVAKGRVEPVDVARAWEEVRRGLVRCGSYHEPAWTSEAIGAAVRALGWREICMTREEDMGTLRAQFERYLKAGTETALRNANHQRLAEAAQHPKLGTRITYGTAYLTPKQIEDAKDNPREAYELIEVKK